MNNLNVKSRHKILWLMFGYFWLNHSNSSGLFMQRYQLTSKIYIGFCLDRFFAFKLQRGRFFEITFFGYFIEILI